MRVPSSTRRRSDATHSGPRRRACNDEMATPPWPAPGVACALLGVSGLLRVPAPDRSLLASDLISPSVAGEVRRASAAPDRDASGPPAAHPRCSRVRAR